MPTIEEEEEAPMDERGSSSIEGVCFHDDLPPFFDPGEPRGDFMIGVGGSDGAPDLYFFLGDESTCTTSAAFTGGSVGRNALPRPTDIK